MLLSAQFSPLFFASVLCSNYMSPAQDRNPGLPWAPITDNGTSAAEFDPRTSDPGTPEDVAFRSLEKMLAPSKLLEFFTVEKAVLCHNRMRMAGLRALRDDLASKAAFKKGAMEGKDQWTAGAPCLYCHGF